MEMRINTKAEVDARILRIHCKVTDRFCADLLDKNGEVLFEQEDGYVPSFMPGDHYGDYLIMDIDLETGLIRDWKYPDADDLEAWVNKGG